VSRTALVLGAGLGGMVAAQALRRLLPRGDQVVLVEREETHVFPPSLLWLMVGERTTEAISRPVEHAIREGIELVRGEVTALDPAARTVRVGSRNLHGDAIVVSLGAEYAPQSIPGLDEAGLCLYSLAGATAIRETLERFERGRIAVLTAAPAYKCPAGPYEGALIVDNFLRQHGRRDNITMEFYAAEPGPMMVAGPAVSAGVRGMLQARGIGYHPEHQVKAVDPRARRLEFANGGRARRAGYGRRPCGGHAGAGARKERCTGRQGGLEAGRRTVPSISGCELRSGDRGHAALPRGRSAPGSARWSRAEGSSLETCTAGAYGPRSAAFAAGRAIPSGAACISGA
jgi:sulfide:quinone oxidoreductase